MSTVHGIPKGSLKWTSDFTHDEDEEGITTASHSFHCHSEDVFKLTPKRGSACQESGWSILKRTGVTSVKVGGGISKVTCKYSYISNEQDFETAGEDYYTYDLGITTSSEEIMSNNRYKDLTKSERTTITKIRDGLLIPKLESDYSYVPPNDLTATPETIASVMGKELADFITGGIIDTYLYPNQVWRATYRSTYLPKSNVLNQVGKITQAIGAPDVSDDRNWLCTGITSSRNSGIYYHTIEWMLSGPGGWQPELY